MKHINQIFLTLLLLGMAAVCFGQVNTGCLSFDGSNDYVSIPNTSSLNPTNVTVECWMYLTAYTARPHIVGKGQSGTGAYWLVVETTREPRFYFTVGNTGTWQSTTTTYRLPATNGWIHMAGTYNGTTARCYIDGVEQGSKVASPSGNLRTNNTDPIYLGRSYAIPPQNLVTGKMDEVRIWNVARTQTQIQDNMYNHIPSPFTNLVGYWRLNESGTGQTASDETSNNNDGTLYPSGYTNGPQWAEGEVTLPVELSSFSAILTADFFVKLHWTTQSETEVRGFYVYRGTANDISSADVVSPLIEATNTSGQHSYEFVDTELSNPGTYYYWLSVQDLDGGESYHGPTIVYYDNDATHGAPGIPVVSGFSSIYPNPFNPSTTVTYGLTKNSEVSFVILNSRGQVVRKINAGQKAAGNWKLIWNGTNDNGNICPTGVYYFKMNAGADSYIRKALLMK